MNRLKHQAAAYWRSLQISEANLIFFVEGGLDRPYYERFVEKSCENVNHKYKICAMKEIGGYQGGKAGLNALYDDLQQENKLFGIHFQKKMAVAFFADKDVDDICGLLRHSNHYIYTPTYDVEGMLFQWGNFIQAIADAGHYTRSHLDSLIGNPADWMANYATNWAEYISLCAISHKHSINVGITFGSLSIINGDQHQPVDQEQFKHWYEKLKNKAGIPDDEFERLYRAMNQEILLSISQGIPMKYFKGKWITSLIQTFLSKKASVADVNLNAIGDRAISGLLANVKCDNQCPHLKHFAPSIKNIINMIG